MINKIPEPYVWWVKVKETDEWPPPNGVELRRDGSTWGKWLHVVTWEPLWFQLTDDDMRRYGFEKCFCSPLDPDIVADNCIAHAGRGIDPVSDN